MVSFHPLQAALLDTSHEPVTKVIKLYRAQPYQLLFDLRLQPKAVDETILTLASLMMWRSEVRSHLLLFFSNLKTIKSESLFFLHILLIFF
ncbi:hypothetical protein [Nostoc sp. DSM 114167]|uniref:hypothetical protein n=1 Tax=Nostoc sp. DSM 114167 TaxID=3439050 RepID=UPI004045B423